jgi:hypothetical protein
MALQNFLAGVKDQWDKGGERILLGDIRCSGEVIVRPIYIQCAGVCVLKGLLVIWIQTEFTMCPYNSNFRKIRLPQDLCFSGNACVIQRYFPKIMATFTNYDKRRFKILFRPIPPPTDWILDFHAVLRINTTNSLNNVKRLMFIITMVPCKVRHS